MSEENMNKAPEAVEHEAPGGERLFTVDEVNKIVQDRVKRVKAAKQAEESQAQEEDLKKRISELEKREKDIISRESRLNCRDYLINQGYKTELLDVLDTSNFEEFKKKADKLQGLYHNMTGSGQPLANHDNQNGAGNFEQAFAKPLYDPSGKAKKRYPGYGK